jgi:hypothetical protein
MKSRLFRSILVLFLVPLLASCALGGGDQKGTTDGNEPGLENLSDFGFTWRRTGGIAGLCDVVTLTGDGTGIVQSCVTDPPKTIGEVTLTPAMVEQLTDWIDRFASFEYEESDPAVADMMVIFIEFSGRGSAPPAADDYAALQNFAIEVMRLVGNSN